MKKYSIDAHKVHHSIRLVVTLIVLLGFLVQNVAGSAYMSLLMEPYTTVTAPPVALQTGTAGTSTIYTNSTSAKVSVEAPSVYDFVDNNVSNVDSDASIGTHSNFTAEKYGPDSLFDNLTETDNGGVINDSENFVDDNISNIDGVDDKGAHGNFTAQQYYDSYFDTLTEANTGGSTTYQIHPTGFNDVNWNWDNETNAYDWNNATSAADMYGRATNDIYWHKWNSTGQGTISQVDLRIRLDLTGLSDDYVTISWYVGATQGTGTYEINSTNQGTDIVVTFNDVAEPINGTWEWADIGNLEIRQVGTKKTDPDDITYAVDEVWGWVSASTPNYELDLEIRWTTADYDETNEYLCINVGTTDDEDLKVEVWTGSWTNLLTDLNASSWNNVSISSYLTSDTLIVRFLGGAESGDANQDSWQIECSLLHVWSYEYNYNLDLEIQWTDANYTRTNEELCIKTGTTDTEDIEVYAWNITGSSWHKVFDDLAANTWNNISVSDYLTDTIFTVRFRGGNETGDATQSSWDIDASLLHIWNDIEDYVDNNTSNVGTHSNFTAQQYGPDSIYDTLTEENITVGGSGIGIDAQTGATDTDATVSWKHTVGTGSNRLLVVGVAFEHDTTPYPSVSNVQYNSVSLTKIADRDGVAPGNSYTAHASLWYMLNPSSGSHTVDVTASADPLRDIIGYAISYENVKQSVPDDYDANNVTSGNIAVTLTAAADGSLAVFVCACGNEGAYTALTDCTIRDQQNASASESGCIGDAMDISSGDKEVGATHSNINRATIVAAIWQPANGSSSYELDLEVQWPNVDYNEVNEELCIYGGNMSSEDILVDVWNTTTSTWDNVFTDLTANGWKNFSVTNWLTTSNFTVRFRGGNETGDATQSSWDIDATLLHVWTENYVCDYDYVLRVNNTITDSWEIRLKQYADSNIDRLQNCTIYFHNSSDGTSRQIYIQNGLYTNQTGPWYDLDDSETIYIAMTAQANSIATSYVRTYLEIRVPGTTTYAQYIITFEIT